MNTNIYEIIKNNKIKFTKRIHPSLKNYVAGLYEPMRDRIYINESFCAKAQLRNEVVMLHEIIHWSGASNRLKRKFFTSIPSSFNSVFTGEDAVRNEEELIALLGTVYLAGILKLNEEIVGGSLSILERGIDIYYTPNVDMKYVNVEVEKAIAYIIGGKK